MPTNFTNDDRLEIDKIKSDVITNKSEISKNTALVQSIDPEILIGEIYQSFVSSGGLISLSSSDMTFLLTDTIVYINGKKATVDAANPAGSITPNTSGNSRIDLICITREGGVHVENGNPSPYPEPKSVPTNMIALYQVTIPTGTTENLSEITEKVDLRRYFSSGWSLPQFGRDGETFRLMQQDGVNQIGLYEWFNSSWNEITSGQSDLSNVIGVLDQDHGGTGRTSWTANRVVEINETGDLQASAITTQELSYLDGVSSNIQTQINQLTAGLDYQGTWNANTNTPNLSNGVGTENHYYVVGTAGSTTIDGENDWAIGDWIIFNGNTWDKIDNTNNYSHVHYEVGINDNRNNLSNPLSPNDFANSRMTAIFTDDIANSPNTYDSVLTIAGWGDGYRVWQLFSNSSASAGNDNLYYRSGIGDTWGTLEQVWTSADFDSNHLLKYNGWDNTLIWIGGSGQTALELSNGDIRGVNSIYVNDPGEGIIFQADPNTNPSVTLRMHDDNETPQDRIMELYVNDSYDLTFRLNNVGTGDFIFQADSIEEGGKALSAKYGQFDATGTWTADQNINSTFSFKDSIPFKFKDYYTGAEKGSLTLDWPNWFLWEITEGNFSWKNSSLSTGAGWRWSTKYNVPIKGTIENEIFLCGSAQNENSWKYGFTNTLATLKVFCDLQAGIKLGSTTDKTAGVIRWTGLDLEVSDGTNWKSCTDVATQQASTKQMIELIRLDATGQSIPHIAPQQSGVVYDGKLHMTGGMGEMEHHFEYDGTTVTQLADLPGKYHRHASVVFDNKLYVLGGFNPDLEIPTTRSDMISYDGVSWSSAGSLPRPVQYMAAVVFNSKLYVLCGEQDSGPVYSNVDSYDGVSWTAEPPLPGTGRYLHQCVVYMNRIWLMGGENRISSTTFDDVWTFDGTTWVQQAVTMPIPLKQFKALVYKDKVYIFGGYTTGTSNENDKIWAFDGTSFTELAVDSGVFGPGNHGGVINGKPYFLAKWDGNTAWVGTDVYGLNNSIPEETFDVGGVVKSDVLMTDNYQGTGKQGMIRHTGITAEAHDGTKWIKLQQVPPGGLPEQTLVKKSDTDYDMEWRTTRKLPRVTDLTALAVELTGFSISNLGDTASTNERYVAIPYWHIEASQDQARILIYDKYKGVWKYERIPTGVGLPRPSVVLFDSDDQDILWAGSSSSTATNLAKLNVVTGEVSYAPLAGSVDTINQDDNYLYVNAQTDVSYWWTRIYRVDKATLTVTLLNSSYIQVTIGDTATLGRMTRGILVKDGYLYFATEKNSGGGADYLLHRVNLAEWDNMLANETPAEADWKWFDVQDHNASFLSPTYPFHTGTNFVYFGFSVNLGASQTIVKIPTDGSWLYTEIIEVDIGSVRSGYLIEGGLIVPDIEHFSAYVMLNTANNQATDSFLRMSTSDDSFSSFQLETATAGQYAEGSIKWAGYDDHFIYGISDDDGYKLYTKTRDN